MCKLMFLILKIYSNKGNSYILVQMLSLNSEAMEKSRSEYCNIEVIDLLDKMRLISK